MPGKPRTETDDYSLRDGNLVIAAIASCTNTSNPDALVAAGLLALATPAGRTSPPSRAAYA